MKKFLDKCVNAVWFLVVVIAKTPAFLYKFATNPFYRDEIKRDYVEPHMNWKTYLLIFVLALVGITGKVIHYRWYGIKVCFGEQWDTGRETKYGFLFNTCVIDTGRTDADGNKIWNKINRDMNPGD